MHLLSIHSPIGDPVGQYWNPVMHRSVEDRTGLHFRLCQMAISQENARDFPHQKGIWFKSWNPRD